MDEQKLQEVASALDDMSEVITRFIEFSKTLMEQFAETGLLTVETKKEFDSLVFEGENSLKQSEEVLDAQEIPM